MNAKAAIKDLFGGIFIATGAAASLMCARYGDIASALVFGVGLCLVLATQATLLTGWFSTIPIAYSVKKYKRRFYVAVLMLKASALICLWNVVGAVIVAYATSATVANSLDIQSFINAKMALNASPLRPVLAGVVCNILVGFACFIWDTNAKTLIKIAGVTGAVALFVFLRQEHCIANAYYLALAIANGATNGIGEAFVSLFMLPMVGNLAGGLLFGTLLLETRGLGYDSEGE